LSRCLQPGLDQYVVDNFATVEEALAGLADVRVVSS
jgi:hypothetical protein